jgi:hypothetical protein
MPLRIFRGSDHPALGREGRPDLPRLRAHLPGLLPRPLAGLLRRADGEHVQRVERIAGGLVAAPGRDEADPEPASRRGLDPARPVAGLAGERGAGGLALRGAAWRRRAPPAVAVPAGGAGVRAVGGESGVGERGAEAAQRDGVRFTGGPHRLTKSGEWV